MVDLHATQGAASSMCRELVDRFFSVRDTGVTEYKLGLTQDAIQYITGQGGFAHTCFPLFDFCLFVVWTFCFDFLSFVFFCISAFGQLVFCVFMTYLLTFSQ
jgi:hypothetical protein